MCTEDDYSEEVKKYNKERIRQIRLQGLWMLLIALQILHLIGVL